MENKCCGAFTLIIFCSYFLGYYKLTRKKLICVLLYWTFLCIWKTWTKIQVYSQQLSTLSKNRFHSEFSSWAGNVVLQIAGVGTMTQIFQVLQIYHFTNSLLILDWNKIGQELFHVIIRSQPLIPESVPCTF